MSKRKRLLRILPVLPPLLFGLLYGSGYIAQFMRNYSEWQSAGGTPGDGTSPVAPSFAVSACFEAIFSMPYGIFGILICVGVLALLLVMVMRMGYSETGEYDKERNFIYSKKGTYGTSGFMSEKKQRKSSICQQAYETATARSSVCLAAGMCVCEATVCSTKMWLSTAPAAV